MLRKVPRRKILLRKVPQHRVPQSLALPNLQQQLQQMVSERPAKGDADMAIGRRSVRARGES